MTRKEPPRKELQTQRKLFVEIPPPKKKKARKLVPGLEQWKIPTVTADGRVEFRPGFPSLQKLEDPFDKAVKDIDYIQQTVTWTLKEEARKEKVVQLVRFHDWTGLKQYVAAAGFRVFKDPHVVDTLIALQDVQADDEKLKEQRKQAKQSIEEILTAAKEFGRGRVKTLTKEERAAIVAACQRWRDVCEGLNEAFKQLWKEPEYQTSEPYRKEAIGRLAEKFSISVAEVEAIGWSLAKPSQKARKSTPTDAMFHKVAREFPGRGVKTIEKIWGDYLNRHPDEKRKKRKPPTTPIAKRTP